VLDSTTPPVSPARDDGKNKPATLYVSSMEAPAIAAIDSASGKVKKVFAPLPRAREFQGLAWDATNRLLLVASRGNDNLLVVDPETGKLVHDVYVGAQPLTVAWEPVSGWAFTANCSRSHQAKRYWRQPSSPYIPGCIPLLD